jgi:hypothetical protein
MQLSKAERVQVQHEWNKRLGAEHYLSRTHIPDDFAGSV